MFPTFFFSVSFSFFPRWRRSPPLFLFSLFPPSDPLPSPSLYYSSIRFLLALALISTFALSCSHQILDHLSTERSSRVFSPKPTLWSQSTPGDKLLFGAAGPSPGLHPRAVPWLPLTTPVAASPLAPKPSTKPLLP
jgi:hypothetical protein